MSTAKDITDSVQRTLIALDGLDIPEGTSVIFSQHDSSGGGLSLFPSTAEALKHLRRQIGDMEKTGDGGMVLHGTYDRVSVRMWPPSGTCTKVQTGVETVTEYEVPAHVRAKYAKTVERPVYEWDCGSVLAGEPVSA